MKNNHRRSKIQQLLSEKQQLSIHDVSHTFNVSIATARRDLDKLADEGVIERIHGGAQLLKKAPPEMPTILRSSEQNEEKVAIASEAVKLINPGETVFLGSGTTVMEVARYLPDLQNLTVITNSLLVANVLSDRDNLNLIILGGIFRHSEKSMYGYLVEQALNELNVDKVIFGIRAIDLHQGLTNDFFPEIPTDRKIIEAGSQVIIVADHTKFDRVSTARVCSLHQLHTIITDRKTPPETIQAFSSQGLHVIVA